MDNNQNTEFDEGVGSVGQASQTFEDLFTDDLLDTSIPDMQSPILAPIQPEPSPEASGNQHFDDLFIESLDPTSADGDPIGQPLPLTSNPDLLANFTSAGNLLDGELLHNDFDNGAMNASDFVNISPNDTDFNSDAFDREFPPLGTPQQPIPSQVYSESILQDHLLTTVTPQQLHPNQGYAAPASSAPGFSDPWLPGQAMGMLNQPLPTTATFRVPYANMGPNPIPSQGSPNINPNLAWQKQPFIPTYPIEFPQAYIPQLIPNSVNLGFLPQDNSHSWSPTADPVRRAPDVGPTSNKRMSIVTKEEPGIIYRPKPGFDEEKPWVKTNKNKGLNRRAGNIAAFHPELIYSPLTASPADWDVFTYEATGELSARTYYEPAEIERFLRRNPRDLIIWLQRSPADCARRAGGMGRDKCRFKNCCAESNTIRVGFYRVAFDENSSENENHDPLLNAGYVHLYCMEKFLDFPALCRDLNVQVDNRILPKETSENRMKYGKYLEIQVAQDFVKACKATGQAPEGYPITIDKDSHTGSLCWSLSVAKFGPTAEDFSREKQLLKQDLSHHDVHLGNLEIYDDNRPQAKPKEARRNEPKRSEPKKRRRAEPEPESSSEESSDDDNERRRKHRKRSKKEVRPKKSTSSKKRCRDGYDADLSSEDPSDDLLEYERHRKRHKRSSKEESRRKIAPLKKRRRHEPSEPEPSPTSESTSEDAIELRHKEDSRQIQKRPRTEGSVDNTPADDERPQTRPTSSRAVETVREEELPLPHRRSSETADVAREEKRSRKHPRSSRIEDASEDEARPRRHRKPSRVEESSGDEERPRKHCRVRRDERRPSHSTKI